MVYDPFSSIALTFSGGGFRAAAFALGTLSFLEKIRWKNSLLLFHVKAVSTVSGGTITGALYAESVANNEAFDVFFKRMYVGLTGDKILNEALAILEDENDSVWRATHKRRTLINAFAIAYSKNLTSATLSKFFGSNIGHLEEVTFNATEFANAQPFRFQSRGFFGNGQLNENDAILQGCKKDILIADAIAASSCFPVGFEPIVFPRDFMPHDNPEFIKITKDKRYSNGIGLMDGGIVDNQGIASIQLAQDRRSNPSSLLKPFSLIIVTDVASPYLEPWETSTESTKEWAKSSIQDFDWNMIRFFATKTPWYVWLALIISLCGIVASFFTWNALGEKILLLISSAVFAIMLTYTLAMPWVKKIAKLKIVGMLHDLVKLVPDFYRPLLKHFEKIDLGTLTRMLRERGSSTVSLLSDVFLKHVRRLNYKSIYSDENWLNKRIGNFVYELTDYDFKKKQQTNREDDAKTYMAKLDPELTDPGKKLYESAYIAAKMDTTLWFDDNHEAKGSLDHLIACGQYTTCYNLLVYLTELHHSPTSPMRNECLEDPEFKALYNTLMEHWKNFKKEPRYLLK